MAASSPRRALLPLALLLLVLGACGSDEEPAEPEAPPTVFAQAAEATREAGNADFQLEFSVEGSEDDASTEAFGSADFGSGQEGASGTLTNLDNTDEAEFFSDGETPYVRLADRGVWEVDPGGQEGVLPGSAVEALDFVEAVDGPAGTPGTAATGSGVADLYETTVSLRALGETIDTGAPDRFEVPLDTLPILVWIGQEDGRVLRVRVESTERQADDTIESVTDYTFARFGEAEAPETPEGLPEG